MVSLRLGALIFGKRIPKLDQSLYKYGEGDNVTMGKDRRVGDQVLTHIFVGHVLDHDRDSYCMYYSKTERISKIHDII